MKPGIVERLRRLEKAAALNGMFIVTYQNGSRKKLSPPEAIDAVKDGRVLAIEGGGDGDGNGLLIELLRGLIEE